MPATGEGSGSGELVRTRECLLFEPYAVMRRPEGQQQLMGLDRGFECMNDFR